MQIRIEAADLPGSSCGPSPDQPAGYHHINVGVQRRNRRDELLGLVPGDAPSASWTMDYTATESPAGTDFKGPYIQGPPGGRFIYLSWVTSTRPGTRPCSGGPSYGSARSRPTWPAPPPA
ncbi:MAG: DUF5990 family protein [Actinomycetota bacterium]